MDELIEISKAVETINRNLLLLLKDDLPEAKNALAAISKFDYQIMAKVRKALKEK
ncbi:MAG: hypothetical protein ACYSSI_00145 [Planctomycetota bacterium]|jgi:hypothetical protein